MVNTSEQNHVNESDQVVDRMVQATGVKNATALAKKLNVTPQAISSAKKKGKIPASWVEQIANEFGTSRDWLLHGSRAKKTGPRVGFSKMAWGHTHSDVFFPEQKPVETQQGELTIFDEDGDEYVLKSKVLDIGQDQRPTRQDALWTNITSIVETITEENKSLRNENKALREENFELRLQLEVMKLQEAARSDPNLKDSEELQDIA